MAIITEITDPDAPELAVYTRLTEAQLRSRRDPARALFIAESPNVIRCALRSGCVPVSLLMDRRHAEGKARDLLAECGDVPVYVADGPVLEQLTGFPLTRGILCAMVRPTPKTPGEVCRGAQRVAVLENVNDRTNLGAVFRSAAALGFDAVLLSPGCADPLSRRACRVSMGTVFQIPWARFDGGDPWPAAGLVFLRDRGYYTAALALNDRAIGLTDPTLKSAERLAVFLGAEGDGLSPETVADCDAAVKIPMAHGVDSLNVAAAAAVAFWELGKKE